MLISRATATDIVDASHLSTTDIFAWREERQHRQRQRKLAGSRGWSARCFDAAICSAATAASAAATAPTANPPKL